MAGMLYYPEITPPEEILFQSVLYWDFLATIAPQPYEPYVGELLLRSRTRGCTGRCT